MEVLTTSVVNTLCLWLVVCSAILWGYGEAVDGVGEGDRGREGLLNKKSVRVAIVPKDSRNFTWLIDRS